MNKHNRAVFILFFALALLGSGLLAPGLFAQTVTLKLAAIVPANSPWDLGLKRLAADFDKASDGKVKIVFPQSARVADESDIIQKMRLGMDGALFTTFGVGELYPDSLVLSIPSYIRSDAEFDAALAAMEPLIKSKLGDRYVVLALSKGGWVRYFSREPIVVPADVENVRMSISPSDLKFQTLMQSAGARTVKGTTSDFMLQINSNTVDACCTSPIYIASLWSQLRGKVAYMSSYKVAPFIGAIILNKSSWEKVPAELRPKLEGIARSMAAQTSADSAKLEADAIASLDGIKSPPQSAAQAKLWADFVAQKRKTVIAQMFSSEILDTMDAALAKVRE
jgi:TRAP-type C4-dicarboxylate transport system substrate-binding protein